MMQAGFVQSNADPVY